MGKNLRKAAGQTLFRVSAEAKSLRAMNRAGGLGFERPDRLAGIVSALRNYGPLGSVTRVAAIKYPDQPAIVDEFGSITYAELEDEVNRVANALRARLEPGSTLGILCRNHRGPMIASLGASRAGLNTVWLNTGFSARQASEVIARERVDLLVVDTDLVDVVADADVPGGLVRTATGDRADDELAALGASASSTPPPKPPHIGRVVLLTSGTTGTPKGAPRPEPRSLTIPGGMLDRMPVRAQGVAVIGPPLFHGTGLAFGLLAMSLGSTLVLRRQFDAATFLADSAQHRATSWCCVPIMLQRILALGADRIHEHDLSALTVVFSAGSQLPVEVAQRVTDVLGDVVYNLYGSTEVSVATIATPQDLREAPTSVGRPVVGVRVRILDADGNDVPQGQQGRIFVGAVSPFEGYTGGGGKEIIDGLLSSGDVGRLDEKGRLHIEGRDDDMIVSGGENVFPRELEELLLTHPEIADASAIGVEDADFGQRLRAFVVLAPGGAIDADGVKDFVKQNLARYKVPRDVVFLDELPRNPTGKILKRTLAEL